MNILDSLPDEELLALAAGGDKKAFELLYSRYKLLLLYWLRYKLPRCYAKEAETLFQEVWLNVWKARDRFAPKARLKTWLWKIAQNVVINFLRRQKGILALPESGDVAEQEPRGELCIDISIDLEKALGQLPIKQREAFVLHVVVGLTVPEIAELLEESKETIKSRIHLARKKLKEFEPLRIYFATRNGIKPKRPPKENISSVLNRATNVALAPLLSPHAAPHLS